MLVYIQILRFLAATAVVAFHAWGVAPNYINVPDGTASYGLQYGANGVDLFFVISGFVIFYATHRANPTPGHFLVRRIERIVPLYFFVTIAVTALAFLFPVSFDTPGWFTAQHILKSFGFVSFTDGAMPIVYVGWSLEYEMYFYLCVALLMTLTRETWRAIVTIFSALTIAGQLPGVADALGNYAFLVSPLIMEFVFGVLVGRLLVDSRVGVTELVAAACAIVTLLLMDPGNSAIIFGLPSAVLVGFAAVISIRRPKPSFVEVALERLGDASYSIYLAQVNTISLACGYVARLVPGLSPMALVLAATAIGVLAGLLLNIFVERPLLRWSRSFAAPRVRDAQA